MPTRPLPRRLSARSVQCSSSLGRGETAAPTGPAVPARSPALVATNGPAPDPQTSSDSRTHALRRRSLASTTLIVFVGLPGRCVRCLLLRWSIGLRPHARSSSSGSSRRPSRRLILGRDIHTHVYDLNTFDLTTFPADLCVDSPIAQGTGDFVFRDNDAPNVGPGAKASGLQHPRNTGRPGEWREGACHRGAANRRPA